MAIDRTKNTTFLLSIPIDLKNNLIEISKYQDMSLNKFILKQLIKNYEDNKEEYRDLQLKKINASNKLLLRD